MKIACTGLDLPEGKVKYHDPLFHKLVEKLHPAKVTPYYFEFLPDAYSQADGVAIARDNLLDLLIYDLETVETRLARTENPDEQTLLKKCQDHLEREKPACDMSVEEAERATLKAMGLFSFKPTLVLEDSSIPIDSVCERMMEKAGVMFFYTAGKEEVHAWFVRKGADAVTCAAKIHSDLARGFVKAEIVEFEDFMTAHNMRDAGSKGLTRLVDRNTVIEEKTILEIRFSV